MRPHDASAGDADGPAIDLGLRRCRDERQEKNREANPVQHHELQCHSQLRVLFYYLVMREPRDQPCLDLVFRHFNSFF
jgi:hypothetical protein